MLVSAFFFFFNDTAPTEIYTLSLHDALPILHRDPARAAAARHLPRAAHARHGDLARQPLLRRSEEHTSELQSQFHLVCRLLLEKKNKKHPTPSPPTVPPTTSSRSRPTLILTV